MFETETEEARWWYANRDKLDRAFEEAANTGTLKKLGRADILKRASASREFLYGSLKPI